MIPAEQGQAGLVGGQFGEICVYAPSLRMRASIDVVIAGRGYYMGGDGMIHCVDIRTAEELWTAPGSYDFGMIDFWSRNHGMPYLVDIGNRFIKYDGITGAVVVNSTFMDGLVTYVGNDYQYAYAHQRDPSLHYASLTGPFRFIKLDITGIGSDITDRIVYDVDYPYNVNDIGAVIYDNVFAFIHFPSYGDSAGIDLTDGSVIWHRPISGIEQKPESVTSANGVMFFSQALEHFTAVDIKTGIKKWDSQDLTTAQNPWGMFFAYGQSAAYGNIYANSYAGVVAFNQENGEIEWRYSAGDSGIETPYGTWPFGSHDPVVADGKVYSPTSEHSPTLFYRGQRLHCIDAYDGTGIWSIMGYYYVSAIAEGCLFAANAYDGNHYCFAKGETATTVSVSDKVVAKGSDVMIEGTVLDMSPAQEGTAAVSDASMSAWMEYLHMQQPLPMDATGVAVSVDAVDPNGNYIHLGTATTNTDGEYALLFTPDTEGTYNIVATFEGSSSYYASHDTIYLGVGSAVGPAGPIEPEPAAPLISTEVAIVAAVAVVAVIGIVAYWALRRRK
jgi:outer membrane protein assembly factor BamB